MVYDSGTIVCQTCKLDFRVINYDLTYFLLELDMFKICLRNRYSYGVRKKLYKKVLSVNLNVTIMDIVYKTNY